jgi:Rieske Fe-S protein
VTTEPTPRASRRTVLAAGATGVAALVTGCQTYGNEAAAPPPPPPSQAAPSPTPPRPSPPKKKGAPPEPPPPPPPAAPALAKVSDIPVGGGKIFAEKGVVITQPERGKIRAFSVTCTHQGCPVNEVADGTINCPCHGSQFKVSDGSVANGPAPKGLAKMNVKVEGGSIRLV